MRPSGLVGDLSEEQLIRACAESNDAAVWGEFVRRFHRPISLSIRRVARDMGQSPQEVVDLVQDTYHKLCADKCRVLLEFAGRHPQGISSYIKVIAVNVAIDHFKARACHKRGSGEVNQLPEDIEAAGLAGSLGGQQAIEREAQLREIDDCIEACTAGPNQERDCLIFWLHYRQGMSARAIAALPAVGLSAKGVETVIFRLTRQVRERLVGRDEAAADVGKESSQEKNDEGKENDGGDEGLRPAESY